jgi:dolichol-phosphate mannosyltransferase
MTIVDPPGPQPSLLHGPQPPHDGRTIVLIPTFNEARNVRDVVARLLDHVPADVLIIDDNSPDGTGEIADAMASADQRVFVMHRPRKSGLGRAYAAGMEWALERDYDFVVQMDCDSSHDPGAANDLLAGLANAHVVVGSRYVPGGATVDWPLARRVVSRIGSLYSRALLGLPQRDTTSGFKAWRAELLRQIDLDCVRSVGYVFQVEMSFLAHHAGGVTAEFPIVFPNRERGESKLSLGIISEAVLLVLRLRMSHAPWRRAEPLPLAVTASLPQERHAPIEQRAAA